MSAQLAVGVATHLLSEAALTAVTEACGRVDARTTLGTLQQLELCSPDILIGGLDAGRRLVPDEYLSFVSRVCPDASLLLLCEEALVRPFVSLSEGRVTLIGPNAGAETVYHRLRVLLAERTATHGSSNEHGASSWWAADSRRSGRVWPPRGSNGDSLSLAFELAAGSGVLEYAAAEQEWHVCWPNEPGTLWLLSPTRLPPMSDLSGSHGGRGTTRLPAASGDIAIALSAPPPDDSTRELVRGLAAKAAFGGPSVFDAVRASLLDNAWVSVVEIR